MQVKGYFLWAVSENIFETPVLSICRLAQSAICNLPWHCHCNDCPVGLSAIFPNPAVDSRPRVTYYSSRSLRSLATVVDEQTQKSVAWPDLLREKSAAGNPGTKKTRSFSSDQKILTSAKK